MAFIEVGYIAFFVNIRFIRDNPYFVKGVHRDIGRSKLLVSAAVDLIPKFLAQLVLRIY